MSDQNDAAQTFNAEAARKSTIQIRINQILKTLPVQPQTDVPRETVVNHIIEKISETTELHLSDRDWLIGKSKTGAPVDMTGLVQEQLLLSDYVDKDSVSQAITEGKLNIGCKDDLRTTKQKCDFISKYGEMAYAKLPLHRQGAMPANPADMTAAQWDSLSPLEKARLRLSEQEIFTIRRRTK